MIRKLLAILLLAVLFVASATSAAAQTPNANLSVDSGSGNPGDVNIPISVRLTSEGGAEVSIVNFDLNYDPGQLAVGSVTIGSAASAAGKTMTSSQPSAGKVRGIIYDLEPDPDVIGDGPLATISFNVSSGASPGSSDLTLTGVTVGDLAVQPVAHSESKGTFDVIQPPTTPPPTDPPPPPDARAVSDAHQNTCARRGLGHPPPLPHPLPHADPHPDSRRRGDSHTGRGYCHADSGGGGYPHPHWLGRAPTPTQLHPRREVRSRPPP